MCLGSFWTALQLLWSSVYIVCGATQIVSGIFFLVSIPALNFTSNLVAGLINVVMGVSGGALVCFGKLSPRRQEALLYIACSVLAVNLAAAILREWGLYFQDLTELLKDHPYHLLILYGCFTTRIVAVAVIVASFLDSQFAFCSMQIRSKDHRGLRKIKGERKSRDNLPDIEYIIPKQKPSKSPSKPHAIYNAYAQSWVFDVDQAAGSNNLATCTKSLQNGSPKIQESQQNGQASYVASLICENPPHVDNPTVYIEEASDDSTSNSGRKIENMKSFSRTASPVLLSASSSQSSLNLSKSNKPPIYGYLEKLTEPEVYRSRLNSALSDKEESDSVGQHSTSTVTMHLRDSVSPRSEKVQYASFMQELQKAIVGKKETISPQSTSESISVSEKTQTNSKSSSRQESSKSEAKSSDGEFSRKLEAALQLIQDLESPNTIETPSEAKSLGEFKERERPTTLWRNSNASSDDSDKTQTGIGSIGELTSPLSERQPEMRTFKPSPTGKGASIIVHHPNSQSTSGYSSPTHPASSASTPTQNWSTTSSINGSNTEIIKPVSYSIHNSKCTTVISLYTPNGTNQKGKSVTLVSITGDNDPITTPVQTVQRPITNEIDSTLVKNEGLARRESTSTNRTYGSNGWKSLLRKKKQTPKLCPELEGAIIKSESLAYLSEMELLARHQRNNEMHRKIEERVIQQLGTPRTESKC
ncbi:uncharacterized protein LOC123673671 isoform X2 [Harmonia axyridis]|nr:uncharacterized protein LOC123673671 isoform X2 [Harmonia axyridis]XP_045464219.1 uncharacterized protein LOC123673671 isoform X2 [Harmonia axyridis]XP_045464220.1 uncharacterized protein LOC123673671 isoform X2 [Harmonia axyridis]